MRQVQKKLRSTISTYQYKYYPQQKATTTTKQKLQYSTISLHKPVQEKGKSAVPPPPAMIPYMAQHFLSKWTRKGKYKKK
jgi:hypothetical protein